MKPRIYLDYNASAPLRPEAADALRQALEMAGNASSVHTEGRALLALLDEARDMLAGLLNCEARSVTFTSGATEANNTVIDGVEAGSLIVSAIEHDSVLAAAAKSGKPLRKIPVGREGKLDLDALANALQDVEAPALVSVMAANNETGVIQPVGAACRLTHEAGGLFHTDAVQAVGRVPVDFAGLEADFMTLSAHKIGGSRGVGAIIARPNAPMRPLLVGGGQERGLRAGTENVAGISAFAAAARAAVQGGAERGQVTHLTRTLESEIQTRVPDARIYGAETPRLSNTLCVGLPGLKGETQVMALDLEGIAVSSGAACSSGKVGPSHVLLAMGADETEAREAIRVSLGHANTEADVERFLEAYTALAARRGAAHQAAE